MLILNQWGNKLVNMDMVESIEFDYATGNTYTLKAVMKRGWNDPSPKLSDYEYARTTIKLGEYEYANEAKNALHQIYFAANNDCKTFCMPDGGES